MRVPLLGGAYEGISTDTSAQESINFFFEKPAPGEQHQGALLPVHGASLFVTCPNNGVIRAELYNPVDNLLYVISNNVLYEITNLGNITSRGTLNSSSGPARMVINSFTNEILIVDGINGYIFDTVSNTFTVISDPNFPSTGPSNAAYIDGYFIVEDPNAIGRFRWSDLNDGLSWPDVNFATAESLDSPLAQIIVDKRVIYLLGTNRGELWYSSGDDQTFTRFEFIEAGSLLARTEGSISIQRFDNSVAWISRNRRGQLQAVKAGAQYQPEVISTPEISRKWQELGTSAAHITYAYQIDGHEFFVVTFTGSGNGLTYAYDAETGIWHQRSGPFVSGLPTREITNAHAFCERWEAGGELGAHIVGDYQANGRLYVLRRDLYTWNDTAMRRRATGQQLAADNESRLRFSEVQVDLHEGIATGVLDLSWSNDGGNAWSNPRSLDINKPRVIARKVGTGRRWIFRVETETTGKIIIKGIWGRIYREPFAGRSYAG